MSEIKHKSENSKTILHAMLATGISMVVLTFLIYLITLIFQFEKNNIGRSQPTSVNARFFR